MGSCWQKLLSCSCGDHKYPTPPHLPSVQPTDSIPCTSFLLALHISKQFQTAIDKVLIINPTVAEGSVCIPVMQKELNKQQSQRPLKKRPVLDESTDKDLDASTSTVVFGNEDMTAFDRRADEILAKRPRPKMSAANQRPVSVFVFDCFVRCACRLHPPSCENWGESETLWSGIESLRRAVLVC